ncbi:MAG: asparagine synthase (glutamine-hydrolyzing) [Bdellovibrionales bacterium]
MCGIGGALSPTQELHPLLPLILEDQKPRGPDYSSLVNLSADNLEISLTHNRLAVLDLSELSNQPFVDPASRACVVFNGEIYNFKELRAELEASGETFTTTGDTEVLLRAVVRWGPQALNKLNGMFAFAIWFPHTRTLMLARDRFGVKPCYFINRPNKFAFASNTTALAKFFEPNLNYDYLSRGISYNLYEDAKGSSPFHEIHSLPPGHYLEVGRDTFKLHPYYEFPERVIQENAIVSTRTHAQLVQDVEEALRSAVELRLRSDVPVTLSLSGGLDSALIARFAKDHLGKPFDVFSFGHPEERVSEAGAARQCAEYLGLKTNFVRILDNELPEIFERTLHDQGAPFAHPSVMAQNQVFKTMRAHGYKVALGGQGADEVFMGYRKFQFFHLKEVMRNGNWLGVPQAAAGLAAMVLADVPSLPQVWHYRRRYQNMRPNSSPFRDTHFEQVLDMRMSSYKNLQDRQIADVGFASLLTLLRYEDRNSMGHSVETRMPFLDYRVMELGSALPYQLKLHHGYGKWILRVIADRQIPRKIAWQRSKKAFSLDPHRWLKVGLGQHIESKVRANFSKLKEVFSHTQIDILADSRNFRDPKNFPLLVTAYWLADRV